MEDLQMEHGFLKAPWEVLVRNFRAGHKPVAKEVDLLSQAVNSLIQQTVSISSLAPAADCAGDDSSTLAPAAGATQPSTSVLQQPAIDALQRKLTGLKRKLDQSRANDEHSIMRCHHRIAHLRARAEGTDPPAALVTTLDLARQMDIDSALAAASSTNPDTPPVAAAVPAAPSSSPVHGNGNSNGNAGASPNAPAAEAASDAMMPSTPTRRTATSAPEQPHAAARDDTPDEADDEDDEDDDDETDTVCDKADDTDATAASNTICDIQSRWEKLRLDRALADYMLREGMYDTALMLCKSHSIEHIVDTDIFRDSRVVIEALRRHDCTEGLRWCTENKRRLQKVSSWLEFRLRFQEFVELARARRKSDAIAYMRKHLSINCDADRLLNIQRFMGLLNFDASTTCQPYNDMYGEHKWLELETAFKHDNYRLHGLTRESTIELLLKAGLASLKTRKCGNEADRRSNCPTCVEPYHSLAQSLPRSRHENSILVCSISGEIMDENNPPMALLQGNVYSYSALSKIADENDGIVVDPRTKDKARFGELRKCFIM